MPPFRRHAYSADGGTTLNVRGDFGEQVLVYRGNGLKRIERSTLKVVTVLPLLSS